MNTTALCDQALAHHRAGRLELAERLYREILAVSEGHAEAHHNLGVIEIQRGGYESGQAHLRRALELAPGMGGYWLSLAEGLLMAQRLDEARTVMDRAKAIGLDTPVARALRERILERASMDASVTSHPQPLAELLALQEEVVSCLQHGHLAEAEVIALRLTEICPDDAFGWKAAGTILFKRSDSEGALPLLQKAISLKPRDPECLNTLGNVLHQLGRLKEALGCFQRGLEINPRYAPAHNSMGVTLKELGRVDEAIASHEHALALQPGRSHQHISECCWIISTAPSMI